MRAKEFIIKESELDQMIASAGQPAAAASAQQPKGKGVLGHAADFAKIAGLGFAKGFNSKGYSGGGAVGNQYQKGAGQSVVDKVVGPGQQAQQQQAQPQQQDSATATRTTLKQLAGNKPVKTSGNQTIDNLYRQAGVKVVP